MGIIDTDSCKKYFRELRILSQKSQYIYSFSLLVINNRHNFKVNSEVHNINTRTMFDLYLLPSHLSVSQKGT
jgi:hypothetical protein